LLNTRNEYSSAQRIYEQSLKLQEGLVAKKDEMQLMGPIQILASVYWQTNQKPKAMAMYDRVTRDQPALPEHDRDAAGRHAGGAWR